MRVIIPSEAGQLSETLGLDPPGVDLQPQGKDLVPLIDRLFTCPGR